MIKKNGLINRENDAENFNILNITPRVMHGLLNEHKKLDSLIYKSIKACDLTRPKDLQDEEWHYLTI